MTYTNNQDGLFGQHLTLDLKLCNTDALSDYKMIFDMLHELPELVGMHKITQPYVFPYSGIVPEDSGITGIVILAESHCSIHTFEKKDMVFIDVFSCKPFNEDFIAEYFTNKFGSNKVVKNLIYRGIGFNSN